ncbi:23357_t:CDS:2 [Cetraspora pellucida]|uniref:23357_t:CDS:1 n=1 Tax=Cetraspora pellucida TaxID=1433469 RepID=A0A9N9IWA8_9GLOM|nr:23357_t:CDS:2 [Cetraspora pellucida]
MSFTINEKKVIISYNDVINETIIENFIERTNIYNDNIEKILIYNDAYIEQYKDIPLDLDSYEIEITNKKSKQRSRTSENKDSEPYVPSGMILDTLVTYDYDKKKYVPILNKNGKITNQYKNGIYIQHLYRRHFRPRYEPVHKVGEQFLN